MNYVTLRRQVTEAGLLDRQYGYYAFKIATTFAMLFLAVALLFLFSSFWLHLLAVLCIAFFLMQVGLLGHDAGHQAIFKSGKWNDRFGHVFLTLLVGLAYSYWVDRHNKHHANPNDEEDPDFPVFALSEDMMNRKKGIRKFIARRQHLLFFVYTGYFLFELCKSGLTFNIRLKNSSAKWAELFLLGIHAALFVVAPFLLFSWWKAIIIVIGVRFLWGVYFGSVVASNHKGMKVMEGGEQLGFVERQILTTRNVQNGIITDYVYGGLNNQLEHHLFPTMPRNNLRKCKPFVKKFCAGSNLEYSEESVLGSFMAILCELKRVALSGRNHSALPSGKTL